MRQASSRRTSLKLARFTWKRSANAEASVDFPVPAEPPMQTRYFSSDIDRTRLVRPVSADNHPSPAITFRDRCRLNPMMSCDPHECRILCATAIGPELVVLGPNGIAKEAPDIVEISPCDAIGRHKTHNEGSDNGSRRLLHEHNVVLFDRIPGRTPHRRESALNSLRPIDHPGQEWFNEDREVKLDGMSRIEGVGVSFSPIGRGVDSIHKVREESPSTCRHRV